MKSHNDELHFHYSFIFDIVEAYTTKVTLQLSNTGYNLFTALLKLSISNHLDRRRQEIAIGVFLRMHGSKNQSIAVSKTSTIEPHVIFVEKNTLLNTHNKMIDHL